MVEFINNLIENDLLATFIMSFVPLVELKGGIVFARGLGYTFFEAFGISYLSSTIVVLPIFFLLKPLLKLVKKIKFVNRFACNVEDYINERANNALEKQTKKKTKRPMSEQFIKFLCVFVFIAIPLPMTGVWMGTAIAVFLNLSFSRTLLAGALGNFIAGLFISILAEVCLVFWDIAVLDYILYAMFAIAITLLIVVLIKLIRKKPEQKSTEIQTEKED